MAKKLLKAKKTEEHIFKPKSKEVAEKLSSEATAATKRTLKVPSAKKPEEVKSSHNEASSETLRTLHVEPDRLTYHFGRKLSDDDFGNATVGITLSSSVKENENLSECAERVINFVEAKASEKLTDITEALAQQ